MPGAVLHAELLGSSDGMSVTYTGDDLGGNRAIRCEPPLPCAPFTSLRAVQHTARSECQTPRQAGAWESSGSSAGTNVHGAAGWDYQVDLSSVAYYEVSIGECDSDSPYGPQDCIAVGFGSRHFPLSGKQPGWDRHSFGYHSDDGHVFHGSGLSSEPYGPTFRPGDVVGCGFSVLSCNIFFSLNGTYLGSPFAAKPSQLPLFPIVGIDTHAPIRFNFGQQPFAFDLAKLPAELHQNSTGGATSALKSALRCLVPPFVDRGG